MEEKMKKSIGQGRIVKSMNTAEGDSGIQSTSVVVSLSHALTQDITIDLSSGDSVTIPAGEVRVPPHKLHGEAMW